MLAIERVSGLATVQDQGWSGWRSIGLPPGGAADPAALRIGNAVVGNPVHHAGIELTLGALSATCARDTVIAVTGGGGPVAVDGREVEPNAAVPVAAGATLVVGRATSGRFRYLAVAGGIAVPPQLGSRSTYLPTGFGGLEGRPLAADDRLPLGSPVHPPATAPGPSSPGDDSAIRVTAGPQSSLFPPDAGVLFEASEYRVAAASDRMGTRLEGPSLPLRQAASLPSEPTCLGAIQVPDDGRPIIILGDGPTVGGYPKLGAVIAADLGRFAQLPLGSPVRFHWVAVIEAERIGRAARDRERAALAALVRARG
ncbi:MAG: biotin-dependent carboxyltransferase family protein [Gemmatimonadales bacterium]